MFDNEEVVTQVTEGEHVGKWTCYTPVYQKYLHPTGEWKYGEVGYFETEDEVYDLLQFQQDMEDQDYYTDFVLGANDRY